MGLFKLFKKKPTEKVNVKYESVKKVQLENSTPSKNTEAPQEVNLNELLADVKKAQNQVDRHFAYMLLQDYYYERRKENSENMQACIDWCLRDISELDKLDLDFYQQLQEEKKKHIDIVGQKDFNKWHKGDYWNQDKFDGHILAFKKLSIIYEQSKDYEKAISIVEQAENYYKSHNNKWLPDTQKRLERLKQKLTKE